LLQKLEEAELQASGKIESLQQEAQKEKLTAIRTIETKNQVIENDYI